MIKPAMKIMLMIVSEKFVTRAAVWVVFSASNRLVLLMWSSFIISKLKISSSLFEGIFDCNIAGRGLLVSISLKEYFWLSIITVELWNCTAYDPSRAIFGCQFRLCPYTGLKGLFRVKCFRLKGCADCLLMCTLLVCFLVMVGHR